MYAFSQPYYITPKLETAYSQALGDGGKFDPGPLMCSTFSYLFISILMLSSSNAKEKLRGLTSLNKYRLLKILLSRNRVWFGQKRLQLLSSSLQIRSEKADCDL